jgi:Tfp pilus assembly protein FimT
MTLLEIVVVMSLLVTVTAVAVPTMVGVRQQTALTNAAHTFARDLYRARIEASRRNQSVAVYREGTNGYRIEGLATQTLADGVTFAAGFDSVRFASFGPMPLGAGDYQLALGSHRKVVRIEPAGLAYVPR